MELQDKVTRMGNCVIAFLKHCTGRFKPMAIAPNFYSLLVLNRAIQKTASYCRSHREMKRDSSHYFQKTFTTFIANGQNKGNRNIKFILGCGVKN